MKTATKATVRKDATGAWLCVLPDGNIALSLVKSEVQELADGYNNGTLTDEEKSWFDRPFRYLDGPHCMDPMDDQYAG